MNKEKLRKDLVGAVLMGWHGSEDCDKTIDVNLIFNIVEKIVPIFQEYQNDFHDKMREIVAKNVVHFGDMKNVFEAMDFEARDDEVKNERR